MKHLVYSLLFILLLAVACDIYPQDEYEEQYVVESYLVANRAISHVRLSKTIPADSYYDFNDLAINNAVVEMKLLSGNAGSSSEHTIGFKLSASGIYVPKEKHKVVPNRTYELEISIPASGDLIRAYTYVPDSIKITNQVKDTVEYQSPEQIEFVIQRSDYRKERQNYFIANAISLEPTLANLTPTYEEFYDEEEDDLNDFANNSSGIFNEDNYELNADGTLSVKYPWLGIAFLGNNKLVINTIDDNLYDFLRSQDVQFGGSTLSPGEIQNIIYNIEGGIGVFGSLASDTVQTYIKRKNP